MKAFFSMLFLVYLPCRFCHIFPATDYAGNLGSSVNFDPMMPKLVFISKLFRTVSARETSLLGRCMFSKMFHEGRREVADFRTKTTNERFHPFVYTSEVDFVQVQVIEVVATDLTVFASLKIMYCLEMTEKLKSSVKITGTDETSLMFRGIMSV